MYSTFSRKETYLAGPVFLYLVRVVFSLIERACASDPRGYRSQSELQDRHDQRSYTRHCAVEYHVRYSIIEKEHEKDRPA